MKLQDFGYTSHIKNENCRLKIGMKNEQSAEDYLEAILLLTRKKVDVHAVDVASELGFSKPSVSIAIKKLIGKGYIKIDSDKHISLTAMGKEYAEQIYERHEVLLKWLISIGVSESIAEIDACKMEHVISDETFAAIKNS
jgi:Mn-dependent DtxR family transcriptional regulator